MSNILQQESFGENTEQTVPFSLSQPEYDQSTFKGRFMGLLKAQNPLNAFLMTNKIEKSMKLISEQVELEKKALENGSQVMMTPEMIKRIRKAQYEVASSVHPDTNQILPFYQRFCSYSIINIPVLFGMILSPQTTTSIILWQWVNQTYNAMLNYSNRNASSNLDMKGLGIAYGSAVTASISIGLGMRKILSPYTKNVKGPGLLFSNFLINVTAIGCAGVLNVLIMRSSEMKEGITLVDKEGTPTGKSQIIGKSAVLKTAATRVILPIPPLLIPTVAFYLLEKKHMIPKNRAGKLFMETAIFFSSMAFAPPLC